MGWMLLMLVGCPAPEPEPDEDLAATLPADGPHGVGYQVEEINWATGEGDRTLRVAIWYPSPTTTGIPLSYLDIFPAPEVFEGTEIAMGSFPLIAYSHGHQGYAEASGRLVHHLVSHGHVVVAPDHTDNTFLDGSDRTTAIYWQRPGDISAVLDHVQDSAHWLSPTLDGGPVTAMGHSFGGYTLHGLAGASFDPAVIDACLDGSDTSAFCSTMTVDQRARFETGFRDPRIQSWISMAPGDHRLFGDAGYGPIDTPVLLMTGGLDDVEQGDSQWRALERPGNLRVHIEDAGHNAFSDVATGLDSGPGFIEAEAGWDVIGAYQLAWIRYQAGEETMLPALNGTIEFHPTASVTGAP